MNGDSILKLETMRRRAKKDSNHNDVVRELRQAGFTVLETHQLGDDKPDLVVGGYGLTGLVELKPAGAGHKDRIDRQREYLDAWAGDLAFIATTSEQIIKRFQSIALVRDGVAQPSMSNDGQA